jgi:hypothetical protein
MPSFPNFTSFTSKYFPEVLLQCFEIAILDQSVIVSHCCTPPPPRGLGDVPSINFQMVIFFSPFPFCGLQKGKGSVMEDAVRSEGVKRSEKGGWIGVGISG